MANWWDAYPDAPQGHPGRGQPANWWDAYPDAPPQPHEAAASRFQQGPAGSGGRAPPLLSQSAVPQPLQDIREGAIETIRGIPERYAAGQAEVDATGTGPYGALKRVVGRSIYGLGNVIMGSPAAQAAFDVGMSGYTPVGKRGIENEPVRSVEGNIRPVSRDVREPPAMAPPSPPAGRAVPGPGSQAPIPAVSRQDIATEKPAEAPSTKAPLPTYPPNQASEPGAEGKPKTLEEQAKAEGFDTSKEFWHGTTLGKFTKFREPTVEDDVLGPASYLSTKSGANFYGPGRGGNLLGPFWTKGKIATPDTMVPYVLSGPQAGKMAPAINALMRLKFELEPGHRELWGKDLTNAQYAREFWKRRGVSGYDSGAGLEVAVYDPENIRAGFSIDEGPSKSLPGGAALSGGMFDEGKTKPQALSAAPGPPGAKPGVKATHADVIEQELEHYKLANREQLRRTEVRKVLESKPPEMTPEVEQKLYAHAENDFSAPPLTPAEEKLYDERIEPWLDRNKEIFKEIRTKGKALGISDSEIDELHPGYMHRMVQGKTRELDRAIGYSGEEGPMSSHGFGGTYQAPATKSRTFFAIIDNQGNRKLVHVQDGHIYDAATGKLIKSRQKLPGDFSASPGAQFEDNGKTWTFAHAKTSEIEGATPTRYIKSASASVLNNYLELERMRDRLALVQRTQEKFIHEGKATRNISAAKANKWIEPKFPGMRGVYMDARLAHSMDHFLPREGDENIGDYFIRVSNFMNSTLFWNGVFPHGRNIFQHAFTERAWDNFLPWTYPGAAKDAALAFNDVRNNSKLYQEVQIAGGATMFPRVANRNLFQKMVEGFEEPENKSALASFATKLAIPFKALHDLVYVKYSQQGLWFVNDMAIMQRVREKVRRVPGMTVAKAVHEVHKDIPDYRIPSEVLFPGKPGRMFSQIIGGRYTNLGLRFTRFHYGVAKTYLHPLVDIAKGLRRINNPEARRTGINAIGKLFALAAGYEALNAVGNPAVQQLTGDEKARIAMWGPLALIRVADDIYNGRAKDPASFLRLATGGLFMMSPLLEIAFEAFGIGYRLTPDWKYRTAFGNVKQAAADWWNENPIKSDVSTDLATVAEKLGASAVAPVEQARRYYERGPGYFAADVTVGAGRTPMTDEEEKAFKKTPDYREQHPRKIKARNEDRLAEP